MKKIRRNLAAPGSRAAHDPLGHAPAPAATGEQSPWMYFVVFFGAVALVMFAMWYHIDTERQSIRAQWQLGIEAIAANRARLVEHWLQARRADAEVLAASPQVKGVLWVKGPDTVPLLRHLDRVVASYGYDSVVVSDTGGRTVAQSRGTSASEAENRRIALSVASTRRSAVQISDDKQRRRLLTIAAPVFAEDRINSPAVLGVVTLRMDADSGLFALISPETAPRTDETLLVRVDASGASYISPLQYPAAGWAAVSRSLTAIQDLAKEMGEGRGSVFGEIDDYRAVPVFAALSPVPLTGWLLALKVDREEVLAEFRRTGQLTGAAGGFLLLAFAACLIAFWRQRQSSHLLRAQVEQERAISSLRGYAEKIVASVPSGLLLLSGDLEILSVNPSFLEAFRLSQENVVGRPLHEVVQGDGLVRRAKDVLESGVAQRNLLLDLFLPQVG